MGNCQCQRSFIATSACLPYEPEHVDGNSRTSASEGQGGPGTHPSTSVFGNFNCHVPCSEDATENENPQGWTSSFQRSWPIKAANLRTSLSVDHLVPTSGSDKLSQSQVISNTPVLHDAMKKKASPEDHGDAAQACSTATGTEDSDLGDESSSDNETQQEPVPLPSFRRRQAVCSERFESGFYFREPSWNKHETWEHQLFNMIRGCFIFRQLSLSELHQYVCSMEIHKRYAGQCFCHEGDPGDGLFAVVDGTVGCYIGEELRSTCGEGSIIDESNVLWSTPRKYTLKAQNECIVAFLRRTDYVNLCVRGEFYKRGKLQAMLRLSPLLEMMQDEDLACLVDVLAPRMYETGEPIIIQGDVGKELFLLTSGEACVEIETDGDRQEHNRLLPGSLFGEGALLTGAPRKAHITALTKTECLILSRGKFERLLGSMKNLHEQQYLSDPRSLIADFYAPGDTRGPAGALQLGGFEPDPSLPEVRWFAIYRPTSNDAIAKMLGGAAVGKGLNVKGKSAKQGCLSGFVPFVQISDNAHKSLIEKSPPDSRVKVYYKNHSSRREATQALEKALEKAGPDLKVTHRQIHQVDDYTPDVFGLDIPEPLLREAYIIQPDLSPIMGWETGRRSEPAFMDANLHGVRDASEPKVVLYQNDEGNAMNPRGLLIAYAEKYVKPVVSDFDTFLVGSQGMLYEKLPQEQVDLVNWVLDETLNIQKTKDDRPWMTRWFDVVAKAKAAGIVPKQGKFGYGDPTSLRLIEAVVAQTSPCGAVRHGAECQNLFFPQDLDDQYLIIYHPFPGKPWKYATEPELREFLLERASEGFTFPLNPVWPVRDDGWFSVLQALRENDAGREGLSSFLPPESGILDKVDRAVKELADLNVLSPNGKK